MIAVRPQTASERDEAALIRAARRGDSEAFARLIEPYDQGVFRLAFSLLRSIDDAHDAYQETFLRVYRNLGNFRFDCSFQTWVYRIAANLCVDWIRKRRIRREEPAVVSIGDDLIDRLAQLEERRAEGDPQRQLLCQQLSARLEVALANLTERERLVFELRHYQGLRLRAIGEALGASEEAAKNCLFRATQKLRTALGDLL